MSRNNTGNPIGSTDYRDLQDNMQIAEEFSNSSAEHVVDRLGITRRTIAGMDAQFSARIESLGYDLSLGDYGAGKTIADRGQVVLRLGEYYKASASASLPLVLTGTWIDDSENLVNVGDGVLRQELVANANDFGLVAEIGNYAALDAYAGNATAFYVRGFANLFDGGHGIFRRTTDTPSAANGIYRQDALARWWKREYVGAVVPKWFGAVGDGVTNDTAAIVSLFQSDAAEIDLTDGRYRIVDPEIDGTPVIVSTLAGRTIRGAGAFYATTEVRKLLRIEGDRTNLHAHVIGNAQIAVAYEIAAADCVVSGCRIRDIYSGANKYTAIAIKVDLDGKTGKVVITDNEIANVESVGDSTGANGVGMARAIYVQADQNQTAVTVISNNRIENVIGEEGDAINLINSNGAGTYYSLPSLIIGNSIKTFSRRAVKIQASGMQICNNKISNTNTDASANLLCAIDLIQGGNHSVIANELTNCKHVAQIRVNSSSALEAFENIAIKDNVIRGVGSETANTLIYARTFASGLDISDNIIDCPTYSNADGAIYIQSTDYADVINNKINTSGRKFGYASCNFLTAFGNGWDISELAGNNTDARIVRVDGASAKSLVLENTDTTLTDGELISQIRFKQNDDGSNAVTASIKAIAVGSSGSTAIAICTGSVASPDVERMRVGTTGHTEPGADNTQTLGSASRRWSVVYAGTGAINTSDEREKQDIAGLDDAERRVAIAVKGAVKKFRFRDAVGSKGDAARWHFGWIAQEVIAAFAAEGLDAMRYGVVCYDEWPDEFEQVTEMIDGEKIYTGEQVLVRAAGNRYGVRYDELLAFVALAI